MQWWNCHLASLRAPLPASASPAAFGAWVRVMGYACEQECGGRLRGAALWPDRQWVAACNVTSDDVRHAGGLLDFDGDDLLVWDYPTQRQTEVEAMRSEGAAGGSARTSAKARAARLNGQCGGRPRTSSLETQQEPNGNPTKPNGNPTKPNGANFVGDEFTSKNHPEKWSENPREWKCKENGSVSVSARAGLTETTTTRDFKSPAAGRSAAEETDAAWRDRLRRSWPGVNLEREIGKAEAYVRRVRGTDAQLHRRFFEDDWIPKCGDAVVPAHAGHTPVAPKPSEPPPDGWRELIVDTAYGPGRDREVTRWEDLPVEAREWARQQFADKAKV